MDARRYPKELKNGVQIIEKWSLKEVKLEVETRKNLRKLRPTPRTAPREGSVGLDMVLGASKS